MRGVSRESAANVTVANPNRASRLPLWLTLGIGVALGLRIEAVWSQLPEPMASHFGLSGRPDAFMSKEWFFLVMVVVGGGSVAAVFAAPALQRRLPASLLNIPNRNYWLANDERREIAIERMTAPLNWIGLATAAILAVAVELALRANLHQTNFNNGIFMIFLGVYFAIVIATLVWTMRLFKIPTE